ncbi:hypothetical protein ACL02R_21215 [Streptomyces sp. MS19]|uniref:hypothetical protein n=1 Tax=Streptomyces sp. MS19 TaxID=3385972 RepID=UPI00399FBC93
MGFPALGVVQVWIPTTVVCVVVVLLVRARQRRRGLWQPSSLAVVGVVTLLNTVTLWFVAVAAGGLDLEEACEYRHGVRFDDGWNSAHHRESGRLFPVHARCSADVDLVPSWVNPALVVLALLSLACLGAAVFLGVRNAARRLRRMRPDDAAAARSV